MNSKKDLSTLEVVFECLTVIWSPAAEAVRLQQQLGVGSLEETATAAERGGCEVCFVDLPEKVSGFAAIIEGKPYIALNRHKSKNNLEYTLPHELGHQVLHLNPSGPQRLELMGSGIEEFQAHLFATTWIIWLVNDKQRDEVLRANPESYVVTGMSVIFSILVVVIAFIFYVLGKVSAAQRPALPEPK